MNQVHYCIGLRTAIYSDLIFTSIYKLSIFGLLDMVFNSYYNSRMPELDFCFVNVASNSGILSKIAAKVQFRFNQVHRSTSLSWE